MCFSQDSILQGDSQQMTLTLILRPNLAINDLNCQTEDQNNAVVSIKFSKQITGIATAFETTMMYTHNEENFAIIDLVGYGYTADSFMEMS